MQLHIFFLFSIFILQIISTSDDIYLDCGRTEQVMFCIFEGKKAKRQNKKNLQLIISIVSELIYIFPGSC